MYTAVPYTVYPYINTLSSCFCRLLLSQALYTLKRNLKFTVYFPTSFFASKILFIFPPYFALDRGGPGGGVSFGYNLESRVTL